MLKSHILKWAAAVLLVPAIPVLAKTLTSAKPAAVKPAAARTTSTAESKKLADAIAALSKPTSVTTSTGVHAAKPGVHTAIASTGARTHVVVSGETYTSIAKALYGSSKYWNRIADANPKDQPKSLRPGMVLVIPAFTPPAKSAIATKPKSVTAAIKPKPTALSSTIRPSPFVAAAIPQ
jgi:nucleoid-associated protein YgaU